MNIGHSLLKSSLILLSAMIMGSCDSGQAPEERYTSFQKAVEKENWEKALDAFNMKGKEILARECFNAAVQLAYSDDALKEEFEAILDEALMEEQALAYSSNPPFVKDETAFVTAITKLQLENGQEPLLRTLARGELEMLGMHDEGSRKGSLDLGHATQELWFRKEADGWRLQMPEHGPLVKGALFKDAQQPHRTFLSRGSTAGLRIDAEEEKIWNFYEPDSCLFLRLALQSPDLTRNASFHSLSLELLLSGKGDSLPLIQGRETGDISRDLGYEKATLPGIFSLSELPRQGEKQMLSSDRVVRLRLPFKRPSSGIERIERMEGAFEMLVGGESRTVNLEGFPSSGQGDTLHHKLLEEMGLLLTNAGMEEGEKLSIQLQGPVKAVEGMTVLNGEGERISELGSINGGSARSRLYFMTLSEPVDEDAELQVELMAGQDTVRMPFRFEEVEVSEEELLFVD